MGERVYIFAYSKVLMEFTRRATGSADLSNQFIHLPEFPTDTSRRVIRPNAVTLYSSAWLDLLKEPILVHVPDTAGRFHLMHLMDAWTETFTVPGMDRDAAGAGGANRRAHQHGVAAGWTQTNNASDYEGVRKIQQGYWVMPLSQYPEPRPGITARQPDAPAASMPPAMVDKLTPVEFFSIFQELLQRNPPHPADTTLSNLIMELERLGKPESQAFEEGMSAGAARVSAALRLRLTGAGGSSKSWTRGATTGRRGLSQLPAGC